MDDKIGVGIVTYNRPNLLMKLLDSIKYRNDLELVIVNDGNPVELPGYNYYVLQNEQNLGVGKSKNRAMQHLLDKGCEYIFIIEDDIFVQNDTVFEKYIETSKLSGIQHFNFSQHGLMNKTFDGRSIPAPRAIIDYKDVRVALYPHCVGAFSFYTKKCLETVGLIDEMYYNACEHVDHTYEIIKAGMHPPFWYFADIDESWKYLGDEPWSLTTSTISSNSNHVNIMKEADKIFVKKHGCFPVEIPTSDIADVCETLKKIKSVNCK